LAHHVEPLVYGQLHGSREKTQLTVSTLSGGVCIIPMQTGDHQINTEAPYLINTMQIRTQSAMYAKHTAIHDCTQSEIVKYLAAPPPDVATSVLALTFIIKSVHLRDLA